MPFYSTSGVIKTVPAIKSFWGDVRSISDSPHAVDGGGVFCWGVKPSALKAQEWAEKNNLPLVRLEDGFIRSVGCTGRPALSLYVDPVGVYYDATRPSVVENILASNIDLSPFIPEALGLIEKINCYGISKFNNHTPYTQKVDCRWVGAVLVIDQTKGDLSVGKGMASERSFASMLEAARSENPDKLIIVKRHPEVIAGKKKGYLDGIVADEHTVIVSDCSTHDLFASVDSVYVVTSLAGFEALMAGKKVTCFGAPFYAGWGATDDRVILPRRNKKRSVAEIFAASYLMSCRYVNPVTWEEGTIEDVVDHIILQREMFDDNSKHATSYNRLNWRKKKIIAPFLGAGERPGPGLVEREVVWGQAAPSGKIADVIRAEDGFLRSVGLGSNLIPPLSLVFDKQGLYYDATRASDLESILSNHKFSEGLLSRARVLREALIECGVTKYNLDGSAVDLSECKGKQIVLVIGQVPDDASVVLGRNGGPSNDYELMVAVRAQHQSSFVVYKPHPDVVSGNRPGKEIVVRAGDLADKVLPAADILDLIGQCDEIHTISSLAGFEALIRGKKVVCHGMPFYAGWGLTEDLTSLPDGRRGRSLSVDQLVAGSLILYPRYMHPVTKEFMGPEGAVAILRSQRGSEGKGVVTMGWASKQINKLRFLAQLVGQDWRVSVCPR